MKQFLAIMLILVVIGLFYLAIAGNKIQDIRTEIDISAPPAKIWDIIVNINEWQEWSPIIVASEGVSVGSKLSITMVSKEKGQTGPNYDPVITDFNKPNYFVGVLT